MTRFTIDSRHTNYTYTIEVYVPQEQAPKEGFPVHYVLDGLSYFQFVKDGVRLQSRNTPKTQVEAAIVVGIAHEEATMHPRRFYDFTAPAAQYDFPARFRNRIPEKVGGGEDFYQFIEQELKPAIEHSYPINKQQQTLFGHSLGGYFALWSLFTHPQSFTHYLAISPSIWWNNHELITYAEKFIASGANQYKNSLFIGVGEQEGFMVHEAREMYEALFAHNFPVEFYEALNENHASVVPTVMSRALRSLKLK